MGITNDFLKNEFVQDAIRDSEAKMFKGMLATKFGKVPAWVDEQLDAASAVQIERWSKQFVTANTLEKLLGKK